MKIGAVMRASRHLGRFAFPNVRVLLVGQQWEGNQRGDNSLSTLPMRNRQSDVTPGDYSDLA